MREFIIISNLIVFIFGMFCNRNKFILIGNILFSLLYCFFASIFIIPGSLYFYFKVDSLFIDLLLTVVSFVLAYVCIKIYDYIIELYKKYGLYKKK